VFNQLLEDTPKTVAQIVEKCGVHERSLRGILDAFVSHEIVIYDKEKDVYTASPTIRAMSVKIPGGFTQLVEVFGSIENFLRTGKGYVTNFSGNCLIVAIIPCRALNNIFCQGQSAEREQSYQKTVANLGVMFKQTAADVASNLTPAKNIIDIGAGSGIWSLSMAVGRNDVK